MADTIFITILPIAIGIAHGPSRHADKVDAIPIPLFVGKVVSQVRSVKGHGLAVG